VRNVYTRDDEYFLRYSFIDENAIPLAHGRPVVFFALHAEKVSSSFSPGNSGSSDFGKGLYQTRLSQWSIHTVPSLIGRNA
jgi:hypothetical protein